MIVLGIIGALFVYFIYLYNKVVRARFMLREGWSGIDVQLKKRYDLIPNLVEMVKAYGSHEQKTLEEVVSLRNQSQASKDIKERETLEKGLASDMKKLVALVEAYPDLKANQNFLKLHQQLIEIEDDLQFARRYYNGTVRDLNILVESFPSNIVCSMLTVKQAEFFELEYATERKVPDVAF